MVLCFEWVVLDVSRKYRTFKRKWLIHHHCTISHKTWMFSNTAANNSNFCYKMLFGDLSILQHKAPCTLSVKLRYFTVWCHTWQKNWVTCAVLKGNSAGLTTVLSSHLSHRELRSSIRESHSFLSYLPTPRWHHLKAHPFLAIHSADEHHMLYSFSNTTSYSTFYVFFSSFQITLWPIWLANSKRQPCFYPP